MPCALSSSLLGRCLTSAPPRVAWGNLSILRYSTVLSLSRLHFPRLQLHLRGLLAPLVPVGSCLTRPWGPSTWHSCSTHLSTQVLIQNTLSQVGDGPPCFIRVTAEAEQPDKLTAVRVGEWGLGQVLLYKKQKQKPKKTDNKPQTWGKGGQHHSTAGRTRADREGNLSPLSPKSTNMGPPEWPHGGFGTG